MKQNSNTLRFTVAAGAIALIAAASVAIPIYVIRPFVPEDPHALAFALELRRTAPAITLLCMLALVVLSAAAWKRTRRADAHNLRARSRDCRAQPGCFACKHL